MWNEVRIASRFAGWSCTLAVVALGALPKETSAAAAIGSCESSYDVCLAEWKLDRVAVLKGNDGYLNLAGLFWLKEGVNIFGKGASATLNFPGAGSTIGSFSLEDGRVTMSVNAGHLVRINGQSVNRAMMRDDVEGDPSVAHYKNLAWTVIRRGDQFAVRLRDSEHPALSNFRPIDYFPTDTDLRVQATLHRYKQPRRIRVDTVITGLDYNPQSPGVVRFALDGVKTDLEAYSAGDELFFVFGDKSNGHETYPAGRFLYAKAPGPGGKLTLDFNTAHNPPCAFNEFATCPIASPRNRLPVRIAAGELYDAHLH